jgi:hypothetical protein
VRRRDWIYVPNSSSLTRVLVNTFRYCSCSAGNPEHRSSTISAEGTIGAHMSMTAGEFSAVDMDSTCAEMLGKPGGGKLGDPLECAGFFEKVSGAGNHLDVLVHRHFATGQTIRL